MDIKLKLSDILLFLELSKNESEIPNLEEYKWMLYFLSDYNEVNVFNKRIQELKISVPHRFTAYSLVNFIENYDDLIAIKNNILKTTNSRRHRNYSKLIEQQILLCESKEQAASIINEAKRYGITITNGWIENYGNLEMIKSIQNKWRDKIEKKLDVKKLYDKYCRLKSTYFTKLPLKKLIEKIEGEEEFEDTTDSFQYTSFKRSILVKEFAKRVGMVLANCAIIKHLFVINMVLLF